MIFDQLTMMLVALAPLVAAIASLFAALSSWRNGRDIKEVKHATNSMKDELVAVTRSASKAEGILQGRAEVHLEQGILPGASNGH